MKLSSKISLGMGVLTILAGILACYLLVQMDEINETVTELADQKMPILDLIGKRAPATHCGNPSYLQHGQCRNGRGGKNPRKMAGNSQR